MTGSNPIAGYSKYHADGGMPFPGTDALTLAMGTLEMPDEQVFSEPAPPATARLCIDCRYCTDLDTPRRHGNLLCLYPDPYGRTGVYYAYDRRRSARYCGKGAKWFEDALESDGASNGSV